MTVKSRHLFQCRIGRQGGIPKLFGAGEFQLDGCRAGVEFACRHAFREAGHAAFVERLASLAKRGPLAVACRGIGHRVENAAHNRQIGVGVGRSKSALVDF